MPRVPTTPPSWRLQQIYALWQQGQVRISRWALGTLAFAVLVPLLVLAPYERTSRAASELRGRIAALEAKAKETASEANELAALSSQLAEVVDALESFSFKERQSELVSQMRSLSSDWAIVGRASEADLRAALALAEERDRVQQPAFVQMPNAPPPRTGPQPRPRLEPPRLEGREAIANLPADAPRDEPSEAILGLIEALDRLKLTPSELLESGASERAALLDARVSALADERADETVEATAEAMRERVVSPLRTLMEGQPRAAETLPELATVVAATESEVEAWRSRCIEDSEWYSTVSGKLGALLDLRAAMERGPRLPAGPEAWTARFVALAEAQQRLVATEIARIDAERLAATREADADLAKLASLAEKLRAILPAWIGDLVSPPELLRLYPPAMLVLLGCLGASAWRLRSTFAAMRRAAEEEGVELEAIAESSIWTLVRRGQQATLVTAATYLGGIALLWLLFSYGVSLAHSAANSGIESPESLVDSLVGPTTLPSLRVVGHAAFALAAVLVVVGLRKEGTAGQREPSR